ncbi:hypothetical protein, partial [Streptomyces albidoflavus]|uniref:hypothetical protein n=1 Tax=Streptomyces albidoflavus TaxID=1886 RepID=UPI001C54A4B3
DRQRGVPATRAWPALPAVALALYGGQVHVGLVDADGGLCEVLLQRPPSARRNTAMTRPRICGSAAVSSAPAGPCWAVRSSWGARSSRRHWPGDGR